MSELDDVLALGQEHLVTTSKGTYINTETLRKLNEEHRQRKQAAPPTQKFRSFEAAKAAAKLDTELASEFADSTPQIGIVGR